MSSWAKRRKTIYSSTILILVVCVIGIPAFLLLYKPPTCTDGIINGSERGVDCGGSCPRLCQDDFLSPIVAWTRFEELAPKLYNVAAYIINPNIEGEAVDVPYKMYVYDAKGLLITELTGKVTLPPHRNTLAYKSAINVGERIPAKVSFEFTDLPDWTKTYDSLGPLVIGEKKYDEDSSGSYLTVKMKNSSIKSLDKMAVYVVLYNIEGNALGFSKTYVDSIKGEGSADASFTWPVYRGGSVISIEVLPVAE